MDDNLVVKKWEITMENSILIHKEYVIGKKKHVKKYVEKESKLHGCTTSMRVVNTIPVGNKIKHIGFML